MKNKITAVASAVLMLLLAASVTLPANAQIQATSVEIRGEVFDLSTSHAPNATGCVGTSCVASWNAFNFAGFWYDLKNGKMSENMNIVTKTSDGNVGLTSDARTINQKGLIYDTTKQIIQYKVSEKVPSVIVEHGLDASGVKDGANGSDGVKTIKGGGYYAKIGWQAQQYVSLNGKTNKLSKLILEQDSGDKKSLQVGESWDLGGGWTLSAQSIDAKASPRQAWLVLNKDGNKKDDKVIMQGQTYSYYSSIGGETDAPQFVTYVDSVFAGTTSDMVQLKYTWAIDPSITEVKSSDKFGNMKVMDENLNGTTIRLQNDDSSISLSQDSTDTIMGNMQFRVADSSIARFYPAVIRNDPGTYEVRGEVFDKETSHAPDATDCVGTSCVASWNAFNFAGFWYDLKNGKMSENMTILTKTSDGNVGLTSDARTINQKGLIYDTTKQIIQYKVSEKVPSVIVEHGLDANGTKDGANGSDGVKTIKGGGYYAKIGWQAQQYVSLNGKTNKLSKLILEQDSGDKKSLQVGETWDLGGGWTLSAQSIDAKASPRQAWLVLNKDGNKKDDKVIMQGQTYSYYSSIGGETDAPQFVTYVDSVFAGTQSDMVQLKYTWAIDPSITEVKSSDKFGNMKVMDENLNGTTIRLKNDDSSISLSQDSTANIMGNMQFRVADSSIARFYPKVDYIIGNVTPTPTVTVIGKGTATLTATGTGTATVTGTGTPPPTETVPGATPTPTKTKAPGFNAILAIAGLLAVAYLVLRKRK